MHQRTLDLIAALTKRISHLERREEPDGGITTRLKISSTQYLTLTENVDEAGNVTYTLGFKGVADELVKVWDTDKQAGYLADKLLWSDDFKVEVDDDDPSQSRLKIELVDQLDERVKVSAADQTAQYLLDKLISDDINLTKENPGATEQIRLSLPNKSTSWRGASLATGWDAFPNWQPMQYKRVSRDQVALRGRARYQTGGKPPDGSLVFVLPVGYRPKQTVSFTGYSGRARLIVPPHNHNGATSESSPYTDYQGSDSAVTQNAGGTSTTSQAGGTSNTSTSGSTGSYTGYASGSGSHRHRFNWRHRHTLNWLHSHTFTWLHNHIFKWRHRHQVNDHDHTIPDETGFDSFSDTNWTFVGGNTEVRITPNGEVRLYDAGVDGYLDINEIVFVD